MILPIAHGGVTHGGATHGGATHGGATLRDTRYAIRDTRSAGGAAIKKLYWTDALALV